MFNTWDISAWDSTYLVLLIFVTIAFTWTLPFAAWSLFRLMNTKGGAKDPEELPDDLSATQESNVFFKNA